jgi:hypothetical protein
MPATFTHLAAYNPEGRTHVHRIALPGVPRDRQPLITLRHTGTTNPDYVAAISASSLKPGMGSNPATEALEREKPIFADVAIVGWEQVYDDGAQPVALPEDATPEQIAEASRPQPVPFSQEAARAFVEALPLWLYKPMSDAAATARNFVELPMPDKAEVEATAGN